MECFGDEGSKEQIGEGQLLTHI